MTLRSLLTVLILVSANAFAQTWPAKPLRVIVTFSPGGSSDIVARLIAIRAYPMTSIIGRSRVTTA